jgi:hypothetical protein
MAVAGGLMYRSSLRGGGARVPSRGLRSGAVVVLASGLAVGFLTGFLGVGGGFLIVPALTLVARVPIKEAVGTSLVVIAANCMSGLVAHKIDSVEIEVLVPFLIASLGASMIAARFASRAPAATLKRLFAGMICVAGGMIVASSLLEVGG